MISAFVLPVLAAVLFTVLLAVPVVVVTAPYFAGVTLVQTVRALADGYGLGGDSHPAPVEPPPAKRAEGREPAYLHYPGSQAWYDVRHAARLGGLALRGVVVTNWQRIVAHQFAARPGTGPTSPLGQKSAGSHAVGASLVLGLGVGLLLAGAVLLLTVLGVALALGALLAAALVARYVLRGVDTALLRIRGITLTCKYCAHRVPFPDYTCSRCERVQHRDVRPGRYGLTHRTCRCGGRFPTMVVLKSYALDAHCPHCSMPLAKGTGGAAEIILPVFGAASAGKTQLIIVLTIAVETMASRGEGRFEFADDSSRTWSTEARRMLGTSGRATKTAPQAQPAISMHVQPRAGARRLVHVFDAAGEIFNEERLIQEQHQLTLARTFVFVIDPLSIDQVWEGIDAGHQAAWEGVKAHSEPWKVFERTVQTVRAMGVQTHKVRLVVVISKADLMTQAGRPAADTDGQTVREWLAQTLELGNMVRAMEHNFRDVSYFLTAALTTEHDYADHSVETLVRRMFASEGLKL